MKDNINNEDAAKALFETLTVAYNALIEHIEENNGYISGTAAMAGVAEIDIDGSKHQLQLKVESDKSAWLEPYTIEECVSSHFTQNSPLTLN